MRRKSYCIAVYTVQEGDTLYSIGKSYSVPVCDLMMANQISNPYNLQIGMKICIPGEMEEVEPNEPAEAECRGVMHTIVKGDTLYMIAKNYRVSLNAIMDSNPNLDPYNLRIGMKICIPS
ncbi:LysM peptidoglycan-binding domain-containing protein [Clostridium aminobutyricum]|uniref:LysM peptidoglycan-binding domain-containing protein n=1 Tax=Clostridium aminobutyricum TaxID=33953 RepID=A0A939D6W2_CLOAM|nr:LysM peptidoglycan-binding domain-containing protein [Clostridium aminobutyricum]MBN7771938.1 LysM peptidoglycan-binding domain-containing protein [Clostridium aminobutyricum]